MTISDGICGFRRRLARWCWKKNASRTLRNPIVTFTFDDFPRSALQGGGALLQEKGLKGTYYASLGLMGQKTELGELFDTRDLQDLVHAGHELGCHTFNHLSCYKVRGIELRRSCEENRRRAENSLAGYRLRHFAFPHGHVTLSAKCRLSKIYDTCRGTQPGVNRDPVDLNLLRANPIDSRNSLANLKELIASIRHTPGWLIFYTHDIRTNPSPYGCTERHFRDVVSLVNDSGAEVLTLSEAVSRYSFY